MKMTMIALAAIVACGAAQAVPERTNKHKAKVKTSKAASTSDKSLKLDPRFQTRAYAAGDVIKVCAHPGRMLEIEFAPDEIKISFKMGDPKAWNVSIVDNTFLLRPQAELGDTNLRIITNRRKYWFDLTMTNPACIAPYHIGFTYPEQSVNPDAPAALVDPATLAAREKSLIEARLAAPLNAALGKIGPRPVFDSTLNDNYGFIGPDELMPVAAYDDGDMTYIQFAPNNPLPAIFVVEPDGHEARVGFHVAKDMLVVHRTAKHLLLKRGPKGEVTACLINASFRANGTNPSYTASSGVQRTIKGEADHVSQ